LPEIVNSIHLVGDLLDLHSIALSTGQLLLRKLKGNCVVMIMTTPHENRFSREFVRDLEAYDFGVEFLGPLEVLDEDTHMSKFSWP
jgi:hypothetical protein